MKYNNPVTMTQVVKAAYFELRASDGRFWRFSTPEEARKFAEENGLQIVGGGGNG